MQVQPFASLAEFPDRGTPRLLINRERVGPFLSLPVAIGSQGPEGCVVGAGNDLFFEGDCDDGVGQLARLAGFGEALESRVQLASGSEPVGLGLACGLRLANTG